MHLFRKFKISTKNENADVVKHFSFDKYRMPDHSILLCNVLISYYNYESDKYHNRVYNVNTINSQNSRYEKISISLLRWGYKLSK